LSILTDTKEIIYGLKKSVIPLTLMRRASGYYDGHFYWTC